MEFQGRNLRKWVKTEIERLKEDVERLSFDLHRIEMEVERARVSESF